MAESRDLDRALSELEAAQKGYQEAEDQYEGKPKEFFGSAKLKKALERTGTHWNLPYAGIIVDAVRDRMELRAVSSAEPSVAEWLDESWTANVMDQESDDVTQWGLVYGECYALVWPEDEEDERDVGVYYNSPRIMRLFYDEETGRRKDFAAKVWKRHDGRVRVNLYYQDRLEKFLSKKPKPGGSKDFERYVDLVREAEDDEGNLIAEEVWPIPHDLGEVPVFHFRTRRPNGKPEHHRAYSPQAMVNKLVIGLMASNDFQGFPQRWALAGEADADDSTEFEDDDLAFLEEGEEPTTRQGEDAKLRSGPGELWWLQGVKDVGQFDPADVDAFLSPLRMLLESMGSLTSTPTDFFLSAEGSAPSGESRRVAHAPLTKKVNDRKQNFGATWEEVWSFAAMIGLGLKERPGVSVTWAPSESYDDGDSWEVAGKKQSAGVPRKRTLVEQGYSQDEVDEWYPEDEADEVGVNVLHERVDLLGSIATAAKDIGLAVQLGVMTEEQAQATMESFLRDSLGEDAPEVTVEEPEEPARVNAEELSE